MIMKLAKMLIAVGLLTLGAMVKNQAIVQAPNTDPSTKKIITYDLTKTIDLRSVPMGSTIKTIIKKDESVKVIYPNIVWIKDNKRNARTDVQTTETLSGDTLEKTSEFEQKNYAKGAKSRVHLKSVELKATRVGMGQLKIDYKTEEESMPSYTVNFYIIDESGEMPLTLRKGYDIDLVFDADSKLEVIQTPKPDFIEIEESTDAIGRHITIKQTKDTFTLDALNMPLMLSMPCKPVNKPMPCEPDIVYKITFNPKARADCNYVLDTERKQYEEICKKEFSAGKNLQSKISYENVIA